MPSPNTEMPGRETFEALGRAVVGFEQVVHRLHAGIATMLTQHGLHDQRLSDVMLAELTAMPLIRMYRSLVFELLSPTADDAKLLKQLFSWLVSMTERRNEIVHSTWYLGRTSLGPDNFSIASTVRIKRSGSGVETRISKVLPADLLAFEDECYEAYGAIDRLTGCVTDGGPLERVLVLPGGYKIGPKPAS